MSIEAATPPAETPPAAASPSAPAPFAPPEKYKSEAWVAEIKDADSAWDRIANLQKTLGKNKLVLPDANATPEQKKEFYAKTMREHFGAGKTPDEYVFKNPESLKDVKRNEVVDKAMAALFHKVNVPVETAQAIVEGYENIRYTLNREAREAQAKKDTEYEAFMGQSFGADANTVQEKAQEILGKVLPEAIKNKLPEFSAKELAGLVAIADHFNKKYTGSSLLHGEGGNTGSSAGATVESLTEKLNAVMREPDTHDLRMAKYNENRQKVNELKKQIYMLKYPGKPVPILP